MSEIKEIYVIEWMGPYNSLDDLCCREDTANCCIYLITGHVSHESNRIKYVGITKRLPEKRFSDKDHQMKQIKEKQYWAGRFSVSSYNILENPRNRARAELVEHLIIRYLSSLPKLKILNEKKTKTYPKKPIGIISRWQKRYTDDARFNKPSILQVLPDILLYSENDFWSAPKIRHDID
jgi:hypothetical protein